MSSSWRIFAVLILVRKYDIIQLLTEVAQEAVKEKVIRVIVSTFRVRRLSSCHFSLLSRLILGNCRTLSRRLHLRTFQQCWSHNFCRSSRVYAHVNGPTKISLKMCNFYERNWRPILIVWRKFLVLREASSCNDILCQSHYLLIVIEHMMSTAQNWHLDICRGHPCMSQKRSGRRMRANWMTRITNS